MTITGYTCSDDEFSQRYQYDFLSIGADTPIRPKNPNLFEYAKMFSLKKEMLKKPLNCGNTNIHTLTGRKLNFSNNQNAPNIFVIEKPIKEDINK